MNRGNIHTALATRPGRRFFALHTLAVMVFLYAPLAILVVFSFNKARQTAVWEGFTLEWYAALARNRAIQDAAVNSLEVAAWVTLLSTLIGVPAGIALGRYAFRGRLATQILLYLPLVIPEIVFATAAATFFSVAGWGLSLWTIVIAHVVFSVSYVAIMVRARLAGMDRTLEEAAADLGASPAATFVRVTLPLLMPAVIGGALLAFTVSFDDYLVASFTSGAGSSTLPMWIYSKQHSGITPEINAVCALTLVLTTVLMVFTQWLLGPSPKKESEP